MTKLWHVTSKNNLESIANKGLWANTYFSADERLRDYYIESVEDEQQDPITLEVFKEALDEKKLEPDLPGIEEPISTVLSKTDEQVWEEWQESSRDARACLEIIRSVVYAEPIEPQKIRLIIGNTMVLLPDYFRDVDKVAIPHGPHGTSRHIVQRYWYYNAREGPAHNGGILAQQAPEKDRTAIAHAFGKRSVAPEGRHVYLSQIPDGDRNQSITVDISEFSDRARLVEKTGRFCLVVDGDIPREAIEEPEKGSETPRPSC